MQTTLIQFGVRLFTYAEGKWWVQTTLADHYPEWLSSDMLISGGIPFGVRGE
jgi:hypothetical protein